MRIRRGVTLVIFVLIPLLTIESAEAAKNCSLPDLKTLTADSPECLFYEGTRAYREKKYNWAIDYWRRLMAMKNLPVDSEHLKTSAINNLGYLSFYGLGTKADKKMAVDLWQYAFRAGEEESAYHLCHIYADAKEQTHNADLAGGYCREALRRYARLRGDAETEKQFARIKAHLQSLEKPSP